MLYKILKSLPEEALKDGSCPPNSVLPVVPLDMKDGFIHLSTRAQVLGTLNKYFAEASHVIILHIDVPAQRDQPIPQGKTGNKYRSLIRWEWSDSRKDYFAHLYGDLINEDVADVEILRKKDNQWVF